MQLFKKRKKEDVAETDNNAPPPEESTSSGASSGMSGQVEAELIKIKSRLEALGEVRKSNSERFSRIAEQIGELRGMIVDTNKTMTNVEVASTKAVDLVNAVHPDQLMVAVRRSEGKVESLKANIEANESMMKDILNQLKDIRHNMSFYKGTEQVVKLNQEVKEELFNVKKVQAAVSMHSDRVNTIFLEVEKKFSEFNKFNDTVKDLGRSFEKLASDFDKIRVSVDKKEEKKEFVDLLNKFDKFEKHTSNIMKLLDVKMRHEEVVSKENFKRLATEIAAKLKVTIDPEKIQKATEKELSGEAAEEAEQKEGESGKKEKKPSKLNIRSLFKKGWAKPAEKSKTEEKSAVEKPDEEPSAEKPAEKEEKAEPEKKSESAT